MQKLTKFSSTSTFTILYIFLGFFISSAVEIPSYFVGWYIMDKWGRRWILFATMMTGGISCICCMFVPLGRSWRDLVMSSKIAKLAVLAKQRGFFWRVSGPPPPPPLLSKKTALILTFFNQTVLVQKSALFLRIFEHCVV